MTTATASNWGTITDPDGKVRNRLEERGQYLGDVKAEIDYLNSLVAGRILDIGCGPGWMLAALSGNWDKYGAEISLLAVTGARRLLPEATIQADFTEYADGFFDVIVMHHVIEHMTEPVEAMRTVSRILRPGGILLLGTPDFDSPVARRFGKNYRLLHDPTHISLFTRDSMRELLLDTGFVIDRVEYPFFETRHFTEENLMRLFDTTKVSPPFVGNFMTFYARKPTQVA